MSKYIYWKSGLHRLYLIWFGSTFHQLWNKKIIKIKIRKKYIKIRTYGFDYLDLSIIKGASIKGA